MCDVATIAGVALSGASAAMNASAQAQVQRARDDAMAAERIRQNGLDQEAQALNTKSQDNYQDFETKQDETSAKLADYFTGQQVAEPTPEVALPTTSSNITVAEEAKQRAKAKDFTDKTGTALGELRSFGDLLGANSRLQARNAMEVGQIGGFKRGSSNVLSYELDAANQKGAGLRTFGDILGGLGKVSMTAGLAGPTPYKTTLGEFLGVPPKNLPLSYYPSRPGSSSLKIFGAR